MRISGITYVPRRTNTLRNFVIIFFLIALLIALAITIISVFVGWNLTHPDKKAVTAFSSSPVLNYEEVTFPDKTGALNLSGWFFKAAGSDKTIILAHGYRQNRLQFDPEMISEMVKHGYNVLAFDFRNSGKSEGTLTSVGLYEKNDLLGAVEFIKSKKSNHIVLLGFSMGASTSILAAAESKDVDAVIADSPFSDLKEYLDDNLSVWLPSFIRIPGIPFNKTIMLSMKFLTGIDPTKVSPRKVISQIAPRPMLFITSQDDDAINVKGSEELYRLYSNVEGSRAEFWKTKGAGHVESYTKYPTEYMSKVFSFLDRVYTNK